MSLYEKTKESFSRFRSLFRDPKVTENAWILARAIGDLRPLSIAEQEGTAPPNTLDLSLTQTIGQFRDFHNSWNITADAYLVTQALAELRTRLFVGGFGAPNGIVNSNIHPNAAIELSKLAVNPLARANHTGTQPLSSLDQSGASPGQVAQWNGFGWMPANVAGGGGGDIVDGPVTATGGISQIAPGALGINLLAINPLSRSNHTGTQTRDTISDLGGLAAHDFVSTDQIANGSINNSKIAGGAAIALSKLAANPLDRNLHTGTQLLNTISNAGLLAGLNAAPAGTLTGNALPATVTISSLEALGNVVTGQWNADTIAISRGGTGATTAAQAKANIGLSEVENINPFDMPLSYVMVDALALKANLNSPQLTGIPTAPTASQGTNTGQLATMAAIVNERTTPATLIGKNISGSTNTFSNLPSAQLVGTILPYTITDSNLTKVGTVLFGTWNAGIIGIGYGGTGAATVAGIRANLGLPLPSMTIPDSSGNRTLSATDQNQIIDLTNATLNTVALPGGVPWNTLTPHPEFALRRGLTAGPLALSVSGAGYTIENNTADELPPGAVGILRFKSGTTFMWIGGSAVEGGGGGGSTNANDLTGTTLAPGVVNSSLTSVGTLATLTVTAAINGSVTGSAATVGSIGNLTGVVTSVNRATSIADGALSIAKTSGLQAALDGKLATGGTAASATQLATGRTIGITGDLVWTSPSFNGTGNVTAAGTLATVNANVGTFGSNKKIPVPVVNGKGLVTGMTEAPLPFRMVIPVSDETTPLTVGTSKISVPVPDNFTCTEIRAFVNAAPTGANLIIDVNQNIFSVFSTRLRIDDGHLDSLASATPHVLSVPNWTANDILRVDIDQVGSTIAGAGLKLLVIGYLT